MLKLPELAISLDCIEHSALPMSLCRHAGMLQVLTAKLLVEVLVDSSDATTFQTNIDARTSEDMPAIQGSAVRSNWAYHFLQPFGKKRRTACLPKGDGLR